jgi:hypothetical protein
MSRSISIYKLGVKRGTYFFLVPFSFQHLQQHPNVAEGYIFWIEKPVYSMSLLHPTNFKPSLLSAFKVDGPEWRFHCSFIREQLPDRMREHLSFISLFVSFIVEHSSNVLFI